MAGNAERDALIAKGKAAFRERRFEEAIACLEQAGKFGPADPGTLALLGAAYSMVGRHAAAISTFERAAEVKPDSAQAHHNLAVAFEQAGRPDDAAVHYREAVRLDPNHAASEKALRRLAREAPPPQPKPAARPRGGDHRFALGLLAALIVLVAAGAGVGITWLLAGPTRERAAEERASQCRRNLEVLSQAVLDYARAHDRTLPAATTWSLLLPDVRSALHCPSDPGSQPSYAMNPVLSDKRLDEIGEPERTILLYEVHQRKPVVRHRKTAFYAFADGHIERLSDAPDHLWRLKRPTILGPVSPGEGAAPAPTPEPQPGAEQPAPSGP
jgi:tetratricopeptide (TPR) repeat protein